MKGDPAAALRYAKIMSRTLGLWCFGPFRIRVGKSLREFEYHGVCGPSLYNAKTGDPYQPGPYSAFWAAVESWVKQGCHVDAEGIAVFEEAY